MGAGRSRWTARRLGVIACVASVLVGLICWPAASSADSAEPSAIALGGDRPIPGSRAEASRARQHAFLNTTCTGKTNGRFTSKVTDPESISAIIPAGVAAGTEIKPHSYIQFSPERAAIYAPVNMELVQGALYYEPPGWRAKTTYILHFAVGCDFAIFLDHITDPVPRIKAALNSTPNADTRLDTFLDKPVAFKAGELIGYTIGAGTPDQARQFDFGYYSAKVTNTYVNQKRYVDSYAWKQLHAVCAYDYFPKALKAAYLKAFTNFRGVKVPGARCRPPVQDKPGTLAGGWFYEPTGLSVVPYVAIAADLDRSSLNIAGLRSAKAVRVESPNPTYKDPAQVTDRHCYSPGETDVYYFFVLTSPTTLDLYEGSGPCPAQPTGQRTSLYR